MDPVAITSIVPPIPPSSLAFAAMVEKPFSERLPTSITTLPASPSSISAEIPAPLVSVSSGALIKMRPPSASPNASASILLSSSATDPVAITFILPPIPPSSVALAPMVESFSERLRRRIKIPPPTPLVVLEEMLAPSSSVISTACTAIPPASSKLPLFSRTDPPETAILPPALINIRLVSIPATSPDKSRFEAPPIRISPWAVRASVATEFTSSGTSENVTSVRSSASPSISSSEGAPLKSVGPTVALSKLTAPPPNRNEAFSPLKEELATDSAPSLDSTVRLAGTTPFSPAACTRAWPFGTAIAASSMATLTPVTSSVAPSATSSSAPLI